MIVKTYLFQFVNSFNSLFYIAFIKTHTQGCQVWEEAAEGVLQVDFIIGASCQSELSLQLIMIFLVAFLKYIVNIMFLPMLKYR